MVDFSAPFLKDVSEIVVSGAKAAPLTRLEDFAGRLIEAAEERDQREHRDQGCDRTLETQGGRDGDPGERRCRRPLPQRQSRDDRQRRTETRDPPRTRCLGRLRRAGHDHFP